MNIFRVHRSRINYWSLSKVADIVHNWLNAPKKLRQGTFKQFDNFDDELKKYKFAYWLDNTFWNGLQNTIYYPYDVYWTIVYAIKARFTEQRHSLKSGLPKWQYRDYRELMLFAIFDSFVDDFLIGEVGNGTKRGLFKHWDWECNLRNDGCGDVNYYGGDSSHPDDELVPQAETAIKMKGLYQWWIVRRKEILDYRFTSFEIENKLDEIDNEKLKELIDLRLSFWT